MVADDHRSRYIQGKYRSRYVREAASGLSPIPSTELLCTSPQLCSFAPTSSSTFHQAKNRYILCLSKSQQPVHTSLSPSSAYNPSSLLLHITLVQTRLIKFSSDPGHSSPLPGGVSPAGGEKTATVQRTAEAALAACLSPTVVPEAWRLQFFLQTWSLLRFLPTSVSQSLPPLPMG